MYNRDIEESRAGFLGFEYIGDTAAHLPPANQVFVELYILTTTVIAAISSEVALTGTTFTGVSIPAGVTLKGRFKSITLTSGTVIAYKGI